MSQGTGIYLTWVTGSLLAGILLMHFFRPMGKRVTLDGFVDMFRRYWMHIALVFSIYVWKDLLDSLDRILMANTHFEMTPFIYAIEGDMVLWVQQTFEDPLLTILLTHFYVAGYMLLTYTASFYLTYFDDRWLADRILLAMFYVYALAVPFYLFFNVRVTGDHIPEMATLAYDLTPAIQTWFTRIDPFTNGMPSLHIGIPFAVWLGLLRWDDGERWKRYRKFVGWFTLATGFAIVYLGIHWFLDIIGGIAVAALAVRLADKTQAWVWYRFDERTFHARLAWLLSDVNNWRKVANKYVTRVKNTIEAPTSKLTGSILVVILLLTGSVVLYDAAHQDFPAEGVTHPGAAAGADGWLVALDASEEGNLSAVLMELETGVTHTHELELNEDGNQSQYGLIDAPTEVLVSKNHAVVWQGYLMRTFDFGSPESDPQETLTGPLYEDVVILDTASGSDVDMYVLDDGTVKQRQGSEAVPIEGSPYDTVLIDGKGRALAYVTETEPMSAFVLDLGAVTTLTKVDVNVTASKAVDDRVLDLTGNSVDYLNASIKSIAVSSDHLVVQVNLSSVDRLVIVDLATGNQRLLGDPLFPAGSPSIGHGHVTWQHKWGLNSLSPSSKDLDWDVSYHIIEQNRTYPLHPEDELNQTSPQAMEGHIVWLQDSGGEEPPEVRIHTLEETFEPYSSITLQVVTLLMIPLLIIWLIQRMKERNPPVEV